MMIDIFELLTILHTLRVKTQLMQTVVIFCNNFWQQQAIQSLPTDSLLETGPLDKFPQSCSQFVVFDTTVTLLLICHKLI